MNSSKFTSFLSKTGTFIGLFCVISLSFFFSFLIIKFRYLIIFIIISIFLILCCLDIKQTQNKISSKIGYIPIFATNNKTPYEIGRNIKTKILELLKQNNKIKILVMPESICPFELNKFPEIINWWFNNLKDKKIHIFLGANRKDGSKLYNSIYHLYNNKIINYYDKTHLVFFVEYIPSLYSYFKFFKNIFLKHSKTFCPGENQNKLFQIEKLKIIPCICSEMFLKRDLNIRSKLIFFFANESWFCLKSIRKLMLFYVKLKKIELKKNILYISNDRILYL